MLSLQSNRNIIHHLIVSPLSSFFLLFISLNNLLISTIYLYPSPILIMYLYPYLILMLCLAPFSFKVCRHPFLFLTLYLDH